MTYFMMLFFVFWTLYRLSMVATKYTAPENVTAAIIISLFYASLGTFFFHNIW